MTATALLGFDLPTEVRAERHFTWKNEPQREVMGDDSPNLLFHGPWGSGKTHIGALKAYAVGSAWPNNKIALVRKKRVDLEATLWKKFVDEVLPQSVVVASNDSKLYRKIRNGTEFFGFGLDSTGQVNKLASLEFGMIVVEEAKEITEDDFDEKLIRCLRWLGVPFHQILLMTNPDSPNHWLYRRFFMEDNDDYNQIQAEILPDLPASYYKRLDQLRGIFLLRYRDGKWVAFEGLVYPFDPTKHLLTKEAFKARTGFDEIPEDWKRVLVVDFGFDHPFVCQWWAISPDDIWYLYRQMYHTNRIVSVHAKEILKYSTEDGILKPRAICDHDAEGAATLRSEGILTVRAKKSRLAGQQEVYKKFENDQIFFLYDSLVEMDQRLFMQRKPYKTEDEFPTYTWANRKTKEDMIKADDHGMDAMRYAIYTLLKSILKVVVSSSRKTMEQLGIR